MNDSFFKEQQEIENQKYPRLNHIQTVYNQIKILIQEMTNKKIMRNSKYELLNVKSII